MNKHLKRPRVLGKVLLCAVLLCLSQFAVLPAQAGNSVFDVKTTNQKDVEVTGTVLDESGEPLIGVSVAEKGTTNGAMTDLDGKFTLKLITNNPVLSFSYVGFHPQEVTVGTNRSFNIVLKDAYTDLDEVMVVAYGTAKKASFTGSATIINADALEKAQPVNITQGLQGLSPGLQITNSSGAPGANSSILIRGIGSLYASNSPLIVVDGVPYAGDLNTISPNEIESITVLKDAASASLYGSRAGNGVILITTKKGKAGGVKVNLRANWGTSDFAVKFPKRTSPARQYELTFEGLYNDAVDYMGYSDEKARQYAHDNVTGIYWDESNVTLNDGTTRKYLSDWNMDYPVGLDGKMKPEAQRLYNYDVYDEAFSHRLKQDYNIDISGGLGDKNTFFASFSMLNDKGIYVGEQYKRMNGKIQLSTKVSQRVTLDNSINYITSTDYNVSTPFRAFRNFPTVYSAFIWDHNTNKYAVSPYTGGRILDVGEQGRAWWKGWSAFGYLVEQAKNKTDQVFTKSIATIDIFPFLSYRVTYGYDYIQTFNSWNRSPERGTNLKPGDGLVNRDGRRYNAHTFNNIITFNKQFGKHKVNVLAGNEIYAWRNDVWSAGIRNLAMVGMTEISSGSGAMSAGSYNEEYRLVSFLSRAEYDFSDKYYVTGSFRTDGSSRFHKDHRWGKFWSLGASWRISEESFMEDSKEWLSNFKLKASYGEVGNDNIDLYAYQGLFSVNNYYGQSGVALSKLATPELKWETNIQANAGIEATLFDKLSIGFEVFQRKSKDLLMPTPLPYSFGITSYLANVGDVQNNGWELDIHYDAIRTKDFDWRVSVNASSYKNKITSLPGGEEWRTSNDNGSLQYKWIKGGSIYDIYAPLWAGVDTQTGRNTWYKPIYNENGKMVGKELTQEYADVSGTDNYVKIGSALPKIYGGITNTFRYKDFDFSFMLYYSLGSKYYDAHYAESSGAFGANASTEFTEKRWQKPGDKTSVPKVYARKGGDARNASYSTQYIYDNDFLRLRNMTLGYTIPKKIVSKLKINGIRIYAIGENLWTTGTAKDHGTDPENVGTGGVVGDYAGLPIRKTFTFGLNVQF